MSKGCVPRSLIHGAIATLVLGAGAASAAVPGFYVAGSVGQSSSDLKQSDQDDLDDLTLLAWNQAGLDLVDGDSDLDKSDMGFELALGYQFTPNVAVEAAWFDLGDATYEATGTLTDGVDLFDAVTEIAIGVSGPALSLVGSWPLGEAFAVDARAGALFGQSKARITVGLDGISQSESDSDGKTSVLYGVGVSWMFSPAVSLRLGYTRFDKAVLDEVDVRRVSLGLKYAF